MKDAAASRMNEVFVALKDRILNATWSVGAQMPTEMELAKEFQCHRSTVSKALTRLAHEQLVERKRKTGTRVIRTSPLAAESGLQLDACAFIYPSDKHEGIWRTVQGFQEAGNAARRRMLMLTTGTDFRRDIEIVGRLSEFDVKGAAMFPVILGPDDRLYFTQMLRECPFPVVLLQTILPDIGRPCILVDGLHAGYVMTNRLIRQGLRKIGFLGHFAWSLVVREKHSGYRQAMFEAGLDAECAAYTRLELEMRPDFSKPVNEARSLARTYLQDHPDVEGLVCAVDFTALGVLDAAREMGIDVPGDLKVVGIDDFAMASAASVPLTTYRVPYEEMGRRAFGVLSQLLAGDRNVPREIMLRGEPVIRQSG